MYWAPSGPHDLIHSSVENSYLCLTDEENETERGLVSSPSDTEHTFIQLTPKSQLFPLPEAPSYLCFAQAGETGAQRRQ